LLDRYPDTVKIVFKNFPLVFHKFAEPAARAALAAAEQRKFWLYHDELFSSAKDLSNEKFFEIARNVGLDLKKFAVDMAGPQIRQKLNRDIREALMAGVHGTPTIFVNGWLLKDRSFESFCKTIAEELRKDGKEAAVKFEK